MIRKVIKKANLRDFSEVKENLSYWLSKTPEERVEAVEYLRRTLHGSSASFKDLFSSFNAHKVDCLIVGAHALAYHGASVDRFLGVTTFLVNRYAASGELPELRI